ADTDFVGGKTRGEDNSSLPLVYQTARADPNGFAYVIPNLKPSTAYNVTLDFAEIVPQFYTGGRNFNVPINGAQLLTNFDIVSAGAAGRPNTPIEEPFQATADANGVMVLQFSAFALVNGIEITARGSITSASSTAFTVGQAGTFTVTTTGPSTPTIT